MSNVVTCACGKRLRIPEGTTAKAVRCPHCKEPIRLDGAMTAAPPAPAPARPAPAPAPKAPAPASTSKAPPPVPAKKAPPPPAPAVKAPAMELGEDRKVATASKPAARPAPKPTAPPTRPVPPSSPPPPGPKSAPAAPRKRLIEDPPGLWLYVDDPKLIALADEAAEGRATSLRTWGPGDDPLGDMKVEDADDVREYLGKGEYIVWAGRTSTEYKPADLSWVPYLMGGIFVLVGLGVASMGFVIDVPFIAVKIALGLFGFVFAGAGAALIVYMMRGGAVYKEGTVGQGIYLITNRRVVLWVDRKTVRSFAGPMVMNMTSTMHDEDQDVGNIMFSHGMDGNPAGSGFICIDRCSEVEELIRGILIDRVLEKSAAGDGPALIPMDGPNPFKMGDDGDDDRRDRKKKPRKLELWQAAALAMEAEKPLSPEMIASARDHTEQVLEESKLSDAAIEKVLEEMQPGEAAVWAGKPDGDMLAGKAWFMVYVGLGGLAFLLIVLLCIFGMSAAMEGMSMNFAVPLAIIAALVVLGMVALLFYPAYKRWLAGKSFYVLTSRRALTWEAEWYGTPKLEAYGPRDLSNLHVVEDDVVFRTVTTVTRHRKGGTTTTTVRYGFLAQADPQAVEKLIRETLVEPFLEKAYE